MIFPYCQSGYLKINTDGRVKNLTKQQQKGKKQNKGTELLIMNY